MKQKGEELVNASVFYFKSHVTVLGLVFLSEKLPVASVTRLSVHLSVLDILQYLLVIFSQLILRAVFCSRVAKLPFIFHKYCCVSKSALLA